MASYCSVSVPGKSRNQPTNTYNSFQTAAILDENVQSIESLLTKVRTIVIDKIVVIFTLDEQFTFQISDLQRTLTMRETDHKVISSYIFLLELQQLFFLERIG